MCFYNKLCVYCVFAVIEAIIPSVQDFMQSVLMFPSKLSFSFGAFGDMVPRYELPTAVILNQMNTRDG